MSLSEDYLKREQLINSIIGAATAIVEIKITNEQYPEIIYPLDKLFQHRKLIAESFVKAESKDQQEKCLVMFAHINEDIKRVIGL